MTCGIAGSVRSLGVVADLDEAGVAQHLEVAGDPRLVHPDLFDDLAHRALTLADRVEDPTPGGFGDHLEDVERGSGHDPSI